jgi:hypothetical protein
LLVNSRSNEAIAATKIHRSPNFGGLKNIFDRHKNPVFSAMFEEAFFPKRSYFITRFKQRRRETFALVENGFFQKIFFCDEIE